MNHTRQDTQSNKFKNQCRPVGSEALPEILTWKCALYGVLLQKMILWSSQVWKCYFVLLLHNTMEEIVVHSLSWEALLGPNQWYCKMGANASGEESDNIDWDTEDELEIQNFPLSSCSSLTNPGGEANQDIRKLM